MPRLSRMLAVALAVLFSAMFAARAEAAIVVRVDKTTQTMRVIVDGQLQHTWAVSTGRAGYNTPNGSYRPQRFERHWRSRKYGMAPMPHSIFFRGGYAIHGTNMVGRLGRVDSHGCIRLAPANARLLFDMVQRRRGDTRIVIEGTMPRAAPPALVASAQPRTAQMRLSQPDRPQATRRTAPARVAAAAPARRTAALSGSQTQRRAVAGSGGSAQPRAAAAPPARRMAGFVPATASTDRHFMEWYLRR
ncbi:L,D-transpeptidase [Phreatobacter sp.]|uniref:L,D-transpeptidase n=1 Tax=Phreatobacter sp. TaxID=1966341 RepID=UPI003F706700